MVGEVQTAAEESGAADRHLVQNVDGVEESNGVQRAAVAAEGLKIAAAEEHRRNIEEQIRAAKEQRRAAAAQEQIQGD